jgi:hypothetical protein
LSARRLAEPRPAAVKADPDGRPLALGERAVEAVREEWVVEDRWWTGRPLRRRYFELVLVDGVNAVVFHDLARRRWFAQRGA